MACFIIAVFLFFNFFALNLRAEDGIIDCSTDTSNETLCLLLQNYRIESCEDYKETDLTAEDRNFIVFFHNSIRVNVVRGEIKNIPKGYYMKKLSWNPDLAKLAKNWTEQCRSGNPSSFPLFRNQSLVRNVAIFNAVNPSKVSLERLMKAWSTGLDHLTPEIINSYRRPTNRASDFEPAAQMIWWNTSEIGCSRSTYTPIKCARNGGKKTCARYRPIAQLVCTYFPAGNIVGESIFKTNLNKKYICQYGSNDLLCASVRIDDRPTKRINSYRDSRIQRMRDDFREIWPVVMSCAKSWNLDFLFYIYVLFFFIYFIH